MPFKWSKPSCRDGCFFYVTNTKGINSTNKTEMVYANVPSVDKLNNLVLKTLFMNLCINLTMSRKKNIS